MSDTSGPAFPQPMFETPNDGFVSPESYGYGGMTLRDYFAAAALQGLLPKLPLIDQLEQHGPSVDDKIAHNRDIAESCYWLADAMLAARTNDPPVASINADLLAACEAYYYGRMEPRECEAMMGAAIAKARETQ